MHSTVLQSCVSCCTHGYGGSGLKVLCLCCGRHSEILSQGALPYFVDIQNCPEGTMWWWPKDLMQVSQSAADTGGSWHHMQGGAAVETCQGTCGAKLSSELRDKPFKLAGLA